MLRLSPAPPALRVPALRLPALRRSASWILGVLSLLAPVARLAVDRATEVVPALGPQVAGLSAAEIEELVRAAAWLDDARQAAARKDVAAAILKDPKGFSLFAGAHDATQRRAALAEVPYGSQIAKAADAHGVDSLLVAAVVEVESTFDPKAGSPKGAVGLMQLLPSTAGTSRRALLEPVTNLAAGSDYLAQMIARFDGDLRLALAAYNAGPTNVRRYQGVPPFPETEQYVEKVLTRYLEHHRRLWQMTRGVDLGASLA